MDSDAERAAIRADDLEDFPEEADGDDAGDGIEGTSDSDSGEEEGEGSQAVRVRKRKRKKKRTRKGKRKVKRLAARTSSTRKKKHA